MSHGESLTESLYAEIGGKAVPCRRLRRFDLLPMARHQHFIVQHQVEPVGPFVRVVHRSQEHVALHRACVPGVPTANGSIV